MTKHANVAGTKGIYGWKKNHENAAERKPRSVTHQLWKRSHWIRPRENKSQPFVDSVWSAAQPSEWKILSQACEEDAV